MTRQASPKKARDVKPIPGEGIQCSGEVLYLSRLIVRDRSPGSAHRRGHVGWSWWF